MCNDYVMQVHLCVYSWLCVHVEGGAPCSNPTASLNVDCVVCLWLIKEATGRDCTEKMPLCVREEGVY